MQTYGSFVLQLIHALGDRCGLPLSLPKLHQRRLAVQHAGLPLVQAQLSLQYLVLLTNALDHTPVQGPIGVQWELGPIITDVITKL